MAKNDITARYILAFHDKASKGILGVSRAANSLVGNLALAAAAGASLKSAMEFQNILTDIEQKADGGAAAVAGLSEKLSEAAMNAGQLPIEAAKAYDVLLGMGADTRLADSLIDPILKAATAYRASTDELARAGFSLSSNLKLTGAESAKVFDVLAVAGKAGNVEIKDMAASLPTLSALFSKLGQEGFGASASIASALQVVGKVSGGPDKAATNFANLLAKIDSKETRDRFEKFGVNLPAALKKRTDSGEDIIEAFVGEINNLEKRGINVNDIITDQQAGIALTGVRKFFGEYQKIKSDALAGGGTVDGDFARRMKDFEPQLNKFLGLMQVLGIQVMTPLIAILTPVLEWVTSMSAEFPTATNTIVGFAGAGLAASKVFSIFGTNLGSVIAFMAKTKIAGLAMNAAIRFIPMLLGPVGLAIGAVVGAGYLLWKNWDWISAKASELMTWLSKAWDTIVKNIGIGIGKAINFGFEFIAFYLTLPAKMASIGLQLLQKLGEGISSGASAVYDKIVQLAANIKAKFVEYFSNIDWSAIIFAGIGGAPAIAAKLALNAGGGNRAVQSVAGGKTNVNVNVTSRVLDSGGKPMRTRGQPAKQVTTNGPRRARGGG